MTTSSPRSNAARRRVRTIRNLGIFATITGALLLSAPATSFAAPEGEGSASVRYERKSGKVKTKNNLNTKFKKAQSKAERDKKKEVQMMSADQFARQKEAVAREIADKQIGMLTQADQGDRSDRRAVPGLPVPPRRPPPGQEGLLRPPGGRALREDLRRRGRQQEGRGQPAQAEAEDLREEVAQVPRRTRSRSTSTWSPSRSSPSTSDWTRRCTSTRSSSASSSARPR